MKKPTTEQRRTLRNLNKIRRDTRTDRHAHKYTYKHCPECGDALLTPEDAHRGPVTTALTLASSPASVASPDTQAPGARLPTSDAGSQGKDQDMAIELYRDEANETYAHDTETGYACGPLSAQDATSPDLDPMNANPRIEPEDWQQMVATGSVWPRD